MALGIISFGLLSVIGVMPTGLTALRQAMDMTVESQIVQQITSKTLLTPYSQLSGSFAGITYYYDDEGTYIQPKDTQTKARYKVTTQLGSPTYPGSASLTDATAVPESISTIRIAVVTMPGASGTNNYVIQVPNSGD